MPGKRPCAGGDDDCWQFFEADCPGSLLREGAIQAHSLTLLKYLESPIRRAAHGTCGRVLPKVAALRLRRSAAARRSLRLCWQAGRALLMHRTLCRSKPCIHGAAFPRTDQVKRRLVACGQSSLLFEYAAHPSRVPLGSRFSFRCLRGRRGAARLCRHTGQQGAREMRRDWSVRRVARLINACAPVGYQPARGRADCLCTCACQAAAKNIGHESSRSWSAQPSCTPLGPGALLVLFHMAPQADPRDHSKGSFGVRLSYGPRSGSVYRQLTHCAPLHKATATSTCMKHENNVAWCSSAHQL